MALWGRHSVNGVLWLRRPQLLLPCFTLVAEHVDHKSLMEKSTIREKWGQKDRRKYVAAEKQWKPCLYPRLDTEMHLEFKSCLCLQLVHLAYKAISLILKGKIFHRSFSVLSTISSFFAVKLIKKPQKNCLPFFSVPSLTFPIHVCDSPKVARQASMGGWMKHTWASHCPDSGVTISTQHWLFCRASLIVPL